MASIGDIIGSLKLNTTGFVAGVAVAKKSVKTIRGSLETISTTAAKVEGSIFSLKNAFLGLGAGVVIKDITQTAVRFESLGNSLKAATGSAKAGAEAMAFVRSESERLGISLDVSAGAFAKFSGAVKGTELEGQKAREIFTSISEASSVLGLSAEQTEGALTALEQMVSKGNVQAEELRGQLGERLPGAFLIAADAMGVTTKELNKMLEQGQVAANDFLPKFARELRERFAKDVPDAAQSARAEFNRLGNSIIELKLAIANSGLLAFITALAKSITTLFKAVGKVMKESVSGELKSSTDRAKEMHDTVAGLIQPVGKFIGVFSDGLWVIKLSLNGINLLINSLAFGLLSLFKKIDNNIEILAIKLQKMWTEFVLSIQKSLQTTSLGKLLGDAFDVGASSMANLEYQMKLYDLAMERAGARTTDTIEGFRKNMTDIREEIGKITDAGLPSERIAEYTKKMITAFAEVRAEAAKPIPAPKTEGGGGKAAADESRAGLFLPGITEDQLTTRLEKLKSQFMSEEELLNQSLINRVLLVEEWYAQDASRETERNKLLEQIALDHQLKLSQITKDGFYERYQVSKMSAKEQTKYVLGQMMTMTQGMASQNKAMFEINKIAAIANGVLNMKEAATSAYAWGSGIGGPPLGAAMAAIALAAQAAQISSIASSTFGGGTGGGATAGGAVAVGRGTSGVSEAIATEPAAVPVTQTVVIDLGEEDQLISTSAMRGIIERIIDTSGDMGVQLRLA